MRTNLWLAAWIPLWVSAPASSQPVIGAKAGLVTYLEGEVYLDNVRADGKQPKPREMRDNQELRTGNGRAELLLNPCAVLHLDRHSVLKMLSTRLPDTRLELVTGSAMVHNQVRSKDTRLTVEWSGTAAVLNHDGVFRFDAAPDRLKVFEGRATLQLGGRDVSITPGKAFAPGESPEPRKFDMRARDPFEYWSRVRVIDMARASGLAAKERRQREQLAEFSSRAADVTAQTRNPGSFDPNAPASPPPVIRGGPNAGARPITQLCEPKGW